MCTHKGSEDNSVEGTISFHFCMSSGDKLKFVQQYVYTESHLSFCLFIWLFVFVFVFLLPGLAVSSFTF